MFKNHHTTTQSTTVVAASHIQLGVRVLVFLMFFSAPFFSAVSLAQKAATGDIAALKAKAEQGSAFAQNALGQAYYYGKGVPKDEVEAVKWWRKAAEQGGPAAEYNLGNAYARACLQTVRNR